MFEEKLIQIINENSQNYFTDNFDFFRFGKPERDIIVTEEALSKIIPYLPRICSFYDLLEDEKSKELLVMLTAYRILGHRKIKLPLSLPEFNEACELINGILDKENSVDTGFRDWKLYYGNLSQINIPFTLYTNPGAVLINYLLKQYEYQINEYEYIKAEPGDIVIDTGGCWGDTALYFAKEASHGGKVYTFEFIPKNLEIMKKNFDLNTDFNSLIEIVEQPVWEESDIPMYYHDKGPGSKVSFEQKPNYTGLVKSISIDDFVERKGIERIDFIKMDIERAEMYALKGALNTIKQFKPKLAISIYHSLDDFINIIHYINGFGLGYKFYLNHFTIHYEETVLYCKV